MLAALGFGAVLVVVAAVSWFDHGEHGRYDEGIWGNGYTLWLLGLAIWMFVGSAALEERSPGSPLAAALLLAAGVIAAYSVFAAITSPRWMWPPWRHEMERRNEERRRRRSERQAGDRSSDD